MTQENGLVNLVRFYRMHFDYKEADSYDPKERDKARQKYVKYCLHNGLPQEAYLELARESQR